MNNALFLRIAHTIADATIVCPDGSGSCDTGLPTVQATNGTITTVLQVAFGILGGIAVIMVMYGGLQFIMAQGDPSTVAKARKTVIFALVGLGIAVIAESIVSFVLGKLP